MRNKNSTGGSLLETCLRAPVLSVVSPFWHVRNDLLIASFMAVITANSLLAAKGRVYNFTELSDIISSEACSSVSADAVKPRGSLCT